MPESFAHTIGDTEPLEIQLHRLGVPYFLGEVGTVAELHMWRLGDPSAVIVDHSPMVVDPDQVAKRGYVAYAFTPLNEAAGVGIYQARVRVTKQGGAIQQTFPNTTEQDENYFLIYFN